MKKFKNIAVYGGGSFGTALACQAVRVHDNVTLFLRDNKVAGEISSQNTNSKYLGNIKLPANLVATTNLHEIKNFELIIIAVPSYAFNEALELLKTYNISPATTLLIATKGFATNPVELLSDRSKTLLPDNPVAFIAGPNFAKEIAKNLLTSATIASIEIGLAEKIAYNLASEFFIISVIKDIVTLQVAGAIKNIIAIKSGFDRAQEHGDNSRALLIISALKEIEILSRALGGMNSKEENDSKILLEAGILGDLILTCYSEVSRNTKFGYELGRNNNKSKFLAEYQGLIEGRESAKLVLDFINKYNLSMPIVSSVVSELGLV